VSVIYRYRSARLDFVPLLLPTERILLKEREGERERERERERWSKTRNIDGGKGRGRIMAAV